MQAVKRIRSAKRIVLLAVILFSAIAGRAQQTATMRAEYFDSIEVSLLTCAPHEEVYSLYGHSALRWHDLHSGQDIAFNWGIFNFQKPHFVLRFIFGLTDYELGVTDYEHFASYYRRWGSMVSEQVLNLTAKEKYQLQKLLEENYRPENRVYRYNYFYDNCSTRPRDMIEKCIDGTVKYELRQDYEPSFRQMIREKTSRHDWVTEGNDWLLGLRADLKTKRQEQEFLPENLMYDFDYAQVLRQDGSIRQLVAKRRVAVEPGVQMVERDFIISPVEAGIILLVVSILIVIGEWRRHKTFKYWDAFLMTTTGLAGCVLFVMLFSQHPATSTNLQLLLVNPVHLFFLPAVLLRRKTRYWMLLLLMLALLVVGAFIQSYAVLTPFLALSLLLRYLIHLRK